MNTLPKRLRRVLLSSAALLALGAPAIASCGAGFDPISQINTLRVIAVTADTPYIQELPPHVKLEEAVQQQVTFHMTYHDGYVDPKDPAGPARNVQIVWLGGCFNPIGDEYYGCYASLAQLFQGLSSGQAPPPEVLEYFGVGDTFTLKIPKDLIIRRPQPASGSWYGLAYVFFVVCAGTVKPIPPDGTGSAGSFPLGCFDANGNRLGAESFVPGYTQVYAFADNRPNNNPVVNAFTFDGKPPPDAMSEDPSIALCDVPDDRRSAVVGCGQKDPNADCKTIEVDVDVPSKVAEDDPEGTASDGKAIREVVWVDYFADKGSFSSGIKLVSDATTGVTKTHSSHWVPPAEPGRATLWAVVHDARGGGTVMQRSVMVK